MNCAFNLTVKFKNGNTRPRSWNTQITTIYPVVYHGGGKNKNNNYHIDVWFGWPTEPKRDVLYLHSASPSLASPSSLMMSRHFIWQRPITGLGTSSTSNETACGVHCVVVWICCLCRPDYPASPAHSLFCHYFLSVGSWNDSTLRPSVSFAKTQKKNRWFNCQTDFLKLKEKSKGQPLFTRTYRHVILKHVWSVVFEVCIYCNRRNKQRPCDDTWLLFIELKVTLLWLQEDQKQTDQKKKKVPFNIRHNDVNLLLQGKPIVGMGVFILQTSSV